MNVYDTDRMKNLFENKDFEETKNVEIKNETFYNIFLFFKK